VQRQSALVSDCGNGARCDAARGTCVAPICTPGTVRCDGARLLSCSPDGSAWTNTATCASAALCEASAGTCRPPACAPNERACQGAQLVLCNVDRTAFAAVEQCVSAAACDPVGGCQAATCGVNELRCAGSALQQCNAERSGFSLLADCGNPALCDAAGGRCNLCVPGARRCADAATVAVCAASGLTEDTATCGLLQVCSGGACALLGGIPLL
jgi:hypothetical protein